MDDVLEKKRVKPTTDIWFGAFLKFKGYLLHDFEVIRPRRVKYFFEISDEDYKAMKLEFLAHDMSKLKQIMEELKDVSF